LPPNGAAEAASARASLLAEEVVGSIRLMASAQRLRQRQALPGAAQHWRIKDRGRNPLEALNPLSKVDPCVKTAKKAKESEITMPLSGRKGPRNAYPSR
jgi:hypothetical protein